MFRPSYLLLTALCSAVMVRAESKWIHLQTDNFQVYSQANEREARDTLNYFERVHSFFLQMTGKAPSNPLPVYVIVFGSAKEYEPYKIKEFALAYYAGGTDRDYIVMGKTGEQTAQAATHEYVHLVARHAGLRLPLWLNEGMAELYSTLHPLGDSIEFGQPILGRVQALAREKWVPLATILAADEQSAYYNETKKAGNLYNEGWALTQFLATSKEYGPGFENMLRTVAAGTSSAQALEMVYSVPLEKIEKDLRFYISSGSYRKLVSRLKLDISTEKKEVEPANRFDVRLALANLSGVAGKKDSRERLEQLSREEPQRPESWAGLGYLALQERNTKLAIEHFSKAYELGDHSPKLLWDYGRLAERERPQDSLRALSELVTLEPGNVDARLALASVQMNQRQAGPALTSLQPITSVSVAQAQWLFALSAAAQLQLGDRVGARKAAERLQEIATSEEFKQRAASLLGYLDRADLQAQAGQAVAPPQFSNPSPPLADGTDERPTLRRREDVAERATSSASQDATRLEAKGQIIQMDCGDQPRFAVETDQGRKTLVAAEPNRIVVSGNQPTTEGIRCGPQSSPVPVRIRFDPPPPGMEGDGVVREIHFE